MVGWFKLCCEHLLVICWVVKVLCDGNQWPIQGRHQGGLGPSLPSKKVGKLQIFYHISYCTAKLMGWAPSPFPGGSATDGTCYFENQVKSEILWSQSPPLILLQTIQHYFCWAQWITTNLSRIHTIYLQIWNHFVKFSQLL